MIAADLDSLTLKCQESGGTSELLDSLQAAWAAIGRRHRELPAAVVVVGAGSDRSQGLFKWGHFAAMRWRPRGGEGAARPEVLVAGEGLERPAEDVVETLLHEAAHAIADVRGVQDTSRGGRYHNRHYAEVAAEVGLEVSEMAPYGMAKTAMRSEIVESYAREIARVAEALSVYRVAEGPGGRAGGGGATGGGKDDDGGGKKDKGRNLRPAACSCGRRIRVAPSTLAAGPIGCLVCGGLFEFKED